MRGRTATEECPKSLVTPQSLEWLEKFFAWKFSGGGGIEGLPAKEAEAILTLEKEWRENGEQESS